MTTRTTSTVRRAVRRAAPAAAAAALLALPAAGHAAIVLQRASSPARMYRANDDGTGVHRLPGRGTNPVVSPDGTRVAYARFTADGAGALRILRIADGTVVPSPEVCNLPPVWSPDSTRLVCVTETAGPKGVVTGDGLALIDAATGTAQTLVPARGHDVGGASWSPDGTRIAYSDGRFGRVRTDVLVADPADMAHARRVARNATGPVWGPVKIALTRFTSRVIRSLGRRIRVEHSQIWTVNPGGGGLRVLTRFRTRSFLIEGPFADLWTPDGRHVIGDVGGTDFSRMVSIDAGTGRIHGLRPSSEAGTDPIAVSADGRRLLFTEARPDAGARLRTMPVGGGAPRTLLRGVAFVTASADWQP